MKTLDEIKDEVAKEFGYKSFEQFDDKSTFSYDYKTPKLIDEICKRYAEQEAIEFALWRPQNRLYYEIQGMNIKQQYQLFKDELK